MTRTERLAGGLLMALVIGAVLVPAVARQDPLAIDDVLGARLVGPLSTDDAGRFLTGLRRRVAGSDAAAVRVYGSQPHAFLGSAHISAGELIADRLLSPLEVQATIVAETEAP